MTEALELRVLSVIAAGHRTLEVVSSALGVPAAQVDERIRWAIGRGLLIATQSGSVWTFRLTDAGRRVLAVRNSSTGSASSVATLGGPLGELKTAMARAAPTGTPSGAVARLKPVRPPRRQGAPSSPLTPEEEAARAERASWAFALVVVGTIVAIVLAVWLLTVFSG